MISIFFGQIIGTLDDNSLYMKKYRFDILGSNLKLFFMTISYKQVRNKVNVLFLDLDLFVKTTHTINELSPLHTNNETLLLIISNRK